MEEDRSLFGSVNSGASNEGVTTLPGLLSGSPCFVFLGVQCQSRVCNPGTGPLGFLFGSCA